MLSHEVAKRHGNAGLPDDTIRVKLLGTAGQSFGAFLAHGITFQLEGEGNDYVGKGLCGGRIIVKPSDDSKLVAEDNIVVGNTVLYGATAGEVFFRGVAGERFAVRNSGAIAVVEGVGDHGCEYMTGGMVVVLGQTGRNFAAGMSGGVAYVLDEDGTFPQRCNMSMVQLEAVPEEVAASETGEVEAHGRVHFNHLNKADEAALRGKIEKHLRYTGSARAKQILDNWASLSAQVREGHADRISSCVARDRGATEGGRIMGKPTGFMEFQRVSESYAPVEQRLKDYREFIAHLTDAEAKQQGARCMDCGIPFCNNGCPVNNIIPDWNDLVYRGNWKQALDVLHSTNNFPEVTGRICPAPCEAACTLNINNDAVGIKSIEHAIIDKGGENGWVVPQPAQKKTGKKIAVVGSGPAGLAAAQQLARVGHSVTVFEKNSRIGGLLRYGIPDFKLDKRLIDWRMAQLAAEGVKFQTNTFVGKDAPGKGIANDAQKTVSPKQLQKEFDAVILAGGAEQPRDLPVPGRELQGVHYALEFLIPQNKEVAGDGKNPINVHGQACRGHRRWRYRFRLRGHFQSSRCGFGHPDRSDAARAGAGEQAADLAILAAQAAYLQLA